MRPRGVRMLPRYSCACPVCEGAAQTRQRLTYALNGIHKDCSDCARDSSCPAERRVPANSKTRVSLNELWAKVAEIETIRWHFFPSYHGKGPCDGHTGLWKQRARERLRENPVPLASAAALKPIIESLSNTACRVLETINREKNADSWQPNIYGMKSYHEFHLKPADSDFRQGGYFVFGRRRFGDGPYVFGTSRT
eukprot:TRINITY_DN184_c0_g1_i8.p1 TRINITY_DN184_c0_g1~~TRINITY_DN184_c0_g1_i8.p1  ORF type:complete len:195 (+),score=16.23 TRINITY_DN184_c0_g1_i8:631-1215(+)